MIENYLGASVFAVVTAIVGWTGAWWTYRSKAKQDCDERIDRIAIHKDDFVVELLQTARLEMASTRVEIDDLRDELKKLRAMEKHFYHFQQALDHIEALVVATTAEMRVVAERNAKAFLNRMRRLNEAKGTIADAAQAAISKTSFTEGTFDILERDVENDDPN